MLIFHSCSFSWGPGLSLRLFTVYSLYYASGCNHFSTLLHIRENMLYKSVQISKHPDYYWLLRLSSALSSIDVQACRYFRSNKMVWVGSAAKHCCGYTAKQSLKLKMHSCGGFGSLMNVKETLCQRKPSWIWMLGPKSRFSSQVFSAPLVKFDQKALRQNGVRSAIGETG